MTYHPIESRTDRARTCAGCAHRCTVTLRVLGFLKTQEMRCGESTARNIVTGAAEVPCAEMRQRYRACGPEALLWEQGAPGHVVDLAQKVKEGRQ